MVSAEGGRGGGTGSGGKGPGVAPPPQFLSMRGWRVPHGLPRPSGCPAGRWWGCAESRRRRGLGGASGMAPGGGPSPPEGPEVPGGPHRAEGDNPRLQPPGHAAVGAARGVGGFLGCNWIFSAYVELLVNQHPKSICIYAYYNSCYAYYNSCFRGFLITIRFLAIIRCFFAEARCVNNLKITSVKPNRLALS